MGEGRRSELRSKAARHPGVPLKTILRGGQGWPPSQVFSHFDNSSPEGTKSAILRGSQESLSCWYNNISEADPGGGAERDSNQLCCKEVWDFDSVVVTVHPKLV